MICAQSTICAEKKEKDVPPALRPCGHSPFTEHTDEQKEEGACQMDGELQASKRCDSGRGKNKT